MMSHRNLVFLAGSIAGYLDLGPGDRVLSVLSLAHTYGLSWLIATVRRGAGLLLEPSFAYPAKVQQRIDEEAVTVFPGVPTVFAMLLSVDRRTPLRFPSITTVTCAGGALLPSVHDGVRRIFPEASIFPMYGQTECMRVSYLDPARVAEKPTSCGKAIPGTETIVLSADGTPAAPGEIGILHVRGPHVTAGYFGAADLTSEILRDGPDPDEKMLCTHDLFRTDDEGFLYFVARSDEIIKTRGEKVSPVEVENALHAIDGIREAAVVGVPDDVLGEAVRAYVVLEHGTTLTERDLIVACRGSLEAFKVPKQIIVLDELPKTATGKIMKRALVPQPH
jgi:acyl-coenzyme A synthetase/AMP-(fatty) acid ligase